jgi:hypothetical protein
MKMKSPEAMSRTALTDSQAWKARSSVGVPGMPKPTALVSMGRFPLLVTAPDIYRR